MTWIVRVALERPYTFVVLAILILIVGPLAAMRTPTDIFPDIKIPVIGVAFQYTGLSPDEMAGRIISPYERGLTTTVNDIEHIESTSLPGMGIEKIYFQPNVDIRTATAQVTSISQTTVKQMPAGTTPPLILNYNASTVPILQLAFSGQHMSEQEILDLAQNSVRPVLTTIPGAAIPYSYGGKVRQLQIDLDSQALQARGLSAQDVENAIAAQNQILPAGTVKFGATQYTVKLNDAAETIEELNDIPIKSVNGATIYIHDVGHVRDGNPPQQSVVHVDGVRAVLTTILKTGSASTLDIVQGVKDMLPKLEATLPPNFKISLLNDQSLFVKAAISGVMREGVIAAALTSLMILLFLGSWRSTVIIAISIPLAVLSALAALWLNGQTLNIMTLGGLALAVGILVDDATVTIENINWHLEHGKDVKSAILDGAQQIVQPAFVSLLCICIVFVPMLALKGVAGFLFVPMAEAVVFAMIASFILSRTLVPTMAMYLLKPHMKAGETPEEADRELHDAQGNNPLSRFQRRFEVRFERFREGYRNLLAMALDHRKVFVIGFLGVVLVSFALLPFLGSNFFPSVDAGQITIHVRPPVGTRIEHAAASFGDIEREIRKTIPPVELSSIVDNIGLPTSSINTVYNNSGMIGYQDGDIYITLDKDHSPTADYVRRLRERLPAAFPGTVFSFLPADIISQILNFGAPAPIDVQISGPKVDQDRAYAMEVLRGLDNVPGLADARMQQAFDNPQLPKGVTVNLRGQVVTMNTAFTGLTYGLLAAIVLIYMLIVVNFQSWLDPFVIITALPAALAGIIWILFATGTTLSVPALTGAIMCMGVATANSILVVSFARERLAVTGDATLAAIEAGVTRFRPVLMTALAMIIGMAPMALGLGEGGEQNAPLGRAVIGGLIFATCATLMFVPVVFSIVHRRKAHETHGAKSAGPKSGEAYA